MPKRPIQHRLEDKSRVKFQDVLPEMWVYRDKDKDYGIDGEVELFDENEKSRGLIFYIQLKATKSKNKDEILSVDFDIETLNYYKSLDIPVLLVRYSDFDNSIFIKWINNVDLFFVKKNGKTHRIKLSNNDKWNNSTHILIENYLKRYGKLKSGSFGFPLPVSINIEDDTVNDISKGKLLIQIKKELKEYSEFIKIENNNENSLFQVYLNNNKLKTGALNITGLTFHSIELRKKENFAKNISQDILISIAFSLIRLGQVEYSGRLIFENNLKTRLIEKKELLEYFIIPYFYSSFFKEALSIYEVIVDDESFIGFNLISNFHMLLASNTKNEEKNTAIENFFRKQINKEKNNKKQKGIANYNLGNHFNNRNKFLDAIHHFNLARKFEPIYLKQAYFFREIASALFRYGKYKYASKFYLKALSIEEDTHTIALYADSLLFSGEYKKAMKSFDEYLNRTNKPVSEFVLKSILLQIIYNKYKIDKQVRKTDVAIKYLKEVDSKGLIFSQKQLETVFNFDLLNDLAWFNLGILNSEMNNFDDATICFSMSAIINNGDIEAWKNAVISCFNSKESLFLIQLIIATAYFFNRENFLEELYSDLEAQGYSDLVNMFSEIINKILPVEEEQKPTVRIFDGNNKFESIEEIIKGHNKGYT